MLNEEVVFTVVMEHTPDIPSSDPSDPFLESTAYFSLVLQVSIQDDPRLKYRLRESPLAVLERWHGPQDSHLAPDWCHTMDAGDRHSFRQPRAVVSELFGWLAHSRENLDDGRSKSMLCWASAVSAIQAARLTLRRTSNTLSQKKILRRSKRLAGRPSSPITM
ncbi:hypothetical protein FOMPIDRAFT_154739 [Fomitopsis schrenkii]|uniref:Uncharacterized protein n=1 Tax=Fomitopsis schrenkii TaxID=2126942 RepID=S8FNC4_FOMSC|nr:hypothetical protein FOMPIDRAFT_154739 [Fomitopsis schrenkii]